MEREISAGGVVVRGGAEGWSMAVIEPRKEPSAASSKSPPGNKPRKKTVQKVVLALPKGLVDPGENPEQTAIREVLEETGLVAETVVKLGDSKYVYVRSWGDKQKVFKIVSFYLLRYVSGTIDEIDPAMRVEVKCASWIPLDGATRKLAYQGEREIVRRAQQYLKSHPEV